MPMRIDFDPYTFDISRPMDEFEYSIMSLSDDNREEFLDIIMSFLNFDQTTVIIIISFVLIFGGLLKLFSGKLFSYFGSFLSQCYGRLFNTGKKCLITLLWLFFSFFSIHFITGSIKTDLVQIYPAKRIETLKDLADSKLTPTLMNYYPIFDLFKAGVTYDHKRIWSKCEANEKSCIPPHDMNTVDNLMTSAINQERVLISHQRGIVVANSILCNRESDKKVKNFFTRVFVSEPFMTKTSGFIMNRNLEKNLKQKINTL